MKTCLLAIILIGSVSSKSLEKNLKTPREFPCPLEEDIAPCECSSDVNDVASDEDLQRVFNEYFPVKEFTKFRINENNNVTSLNQNTNGVSFKNIYLFANPNLKTISSGFLSASASRIEILDFHTTPFSTETFPFSSLPSYPNLLEISVWQADFTSLPEISNEKLSTFDFTFTGVTSIEKGEGLTKQY